MLISKLGPGIVVAGRALHPNVAELTAAQALSETGQAGGRPAAVF